MEFDRDADIQLAGFSMWVDGYQFPKLADEYWDANWVQVRVVCIGQQATVKVSGSVVHLPELSAWLDACIKLESGEAEVATLPTMEPYVRAKIDRSGKSKGLVATVNLSPDNVSSFHEFLYPIDQSHLTRLIMALRGVLDRLPVRGSR